METSKQIMLLADRLERCHTALADFFPHVGLLEIGGARLLLGTRLMPVLQDCVNDVRDCLAGLDETPLEMGAAKRSLVELWSCVAGLLGRLVKEGTVHEAVEVNEAARLLYLASGLSWNYLVRVSNGVLPHNPNYVRIEPTEVLLVNCQFQPSAPGASVAELTKELCAKLQRLVH